jgi:hypothetical protein
MKLPVDLWSRHPMQDFVGARPSISEPFKISSTTLCAGTMASSQSYCFIREEQWVIAPRVIKCDLLT